MKWKLVNEEQHKPLIKELAEQLSYSPLFISLCLQRGLDTEEKIKSFIQPTEEGIHDPF